MKDELEKLNLEVEKTEIKLAELKNRILALNSSFTNNDKKPDSTLNIEDIHKITNKLEEKNRIIQMTENFFKVGRWTYDFENSYSSWSPETYKIFEYPEDFKGSIRDFYISCLDEETTSRLQEMVNVFRSPKEITAMNQTIITPNGNKKWLSYSSTPIFNKLGEVIGAEGLVKDISDQVTGKNGLNNFFNLSLDLHCIVQNDLYFLKVSPSWMKLLGYTERELLSRPCLELVHPDDLENTHSIIKQMDNLGAAFQFENRYITKSGEVVYLSWNSQIDSETQLVFCTARDVTKSRLEQNELLSDLSEKELLLREIHHRVKNNLQIISSLLSLQAGANSEETHLVKLYEDSQNRIKSMAAIHEMFYQSEELDRIEFGTYMEKLTGDLTNTFSVQGSIIQFSMDVETVYVNLDTAIPLGLIINEIVTNSIKHGEDENGKVNIFIKIKTILDDQLQLTIGDSGVNSLENILENSNEGLGVLLINSLVEQIDGEIVQMNNCGGTTFQLTFSDRPVL